MGALPARAWADGMTYTLTDLGAYPSPGEVRDGRFNGTLGYQSPRIDNAGRVTFGNALPADYGSLSGTVPYQGPAPLDPTSPGGASQPTNAWITANAGQLSVGNYNTNGSGAIPFIFDGAKATRLIGISGNPSIGSNAIAVNDVGQVLLTSGFSSSSLFDARDNSVRRITSLTPGLPYNALAINHSGVIVGQYLLGDQNRIIADHAFILQDVASRSVDLNTLLPPMTGWVLNTATGINDAGQIVGLGTDPSGAVHYYQLNPVPEPTTLAFAGLALAGFALKEFRLARAERSEGVRFFRRRTESVVVDIAAGG
ncbi:MAG: PEP-CTERM sorting domain-containing protein [Isosphaeraceae bacterium]